MKTVNTKIVALFLLIAIAAGGIFIVPKTASAQILGTGPLPVWCVPWDFNCLKEGILDPAAKAIMKKIVRQLRAATINWILTGDFEIKKPFFVTSFIADPQRIADTAARLFLSELTGINFCSFHPNIRSVQGLLINIDLNQTLSCNFNGRSNEYRSNRIGGLIASTHASQNFSTILNNVKRESQNQVQRSISSFAEEVRTNSGFLGQRDPKTGKIKTPGNLIAETLIGAQNSEMFGQEVNQEIFSAIVDVIDTAIGKTIQDGILGNF